MSDTTSGLKKLADAWGRTSLLIRLVIFLGIGYVIYYIITENYQIPYATRVSELEKSVESSKPPENHELQLTEMRQKSADLRKEIRKVGDDITAFTSGLGNDAVNDIRHTILKGFIDNNLSIISEGRPAAVAAQVDEYGNFATRTIEQAKVFPDPIKSHTFVYHAYGRYGDIQKFLLDMFANPNTFLIRDIKISRHSHTYTVEDGRIINAVEITFKLHIPYRDGNS